MMLSQKKMGFIGVVMFDMMYCHRKTPDLMQKWGVMWRHQS